MTIKEAIQVLDLTPPFPKAALKGAYRDALMVWHPDRFQGNDNLATKAASKTYQINEAYVLLKDIPEFDYPFQVPASNQEPRRTAPKMPSTPPPVPTRASSNQRPPPIPTQNVSAAPKPRATAKKTPSLLTIAAIVVVVAGGSLLVLVFEHVKSPAKSSVQSSGGNIGESKDVPSSSQHLPIEKLRAVALQGDKQAQFELADAYMNGQGVARDPQEAIQWYRKVADQGDMNAQYNMGLVYHRGDYNPKDELEAMRWFRKAADQGHRFSQFYLGEGYEHGLGLIKDETEAMKWYRKASDQGHFDAQYRLGMGYLEGRGVNRDSLEAIRFFRLSAAQGNPEAQTILGVCYANGDGVVKDLTEAVKWYTLAADQGLSVAQYNMAMAYGLGEGVTRDAVQANKWFKLAAEQGYADAQYCLGFSYYEGEGVVKDLAEAVKWYRKAAEQGLGIAQFELGHCLIEGKGVSTNSAEGVQWFQKAAEQGEAKAQSWLGACYANGDGISRNPVLAYAWLSLASAKGIEKAAQNLATVEKEMSAEQIAEAASLAEKLKTPLQNIQPKNETPIHNLKIEEIRVQAEKGDPQAQAELGSIYLKGDGVEQNPVEAAKWFRRAAEQGSAIAQFKLGFLHGSGEGVPKDAVEAAKWRGKAAEQGHAVAQSVLGWYYYSGEGVPKDVIEALKWTILAAEQGENSSSNRISFLQQQMTPEQITEAHRKADEFKRQKIAGVKPVENPSAKKTAITPSVKPDEQLKHLPTDYRLISGSVLTDRLQEFGGKGKLLLDNGLTEDACVKLISGDKLWASFYVRGGEKFTFDHVPDAKYHLLYCTGFGWNPDRRDFARGRHAVRYDEVLDYATTQRTEGTTIITTTGEITLTLHKVANGNTKTSDIPLEEFDRY